MTNYDTTDAIVVKGLSKSFDKIVALQNAGTVIQKGSIFGLIGSNGAGKSTFLRLLAGIYRPDAGEILIDGQPVYENEALKQRIFYISDDQFFFPNSNVSSGPGQKALYILKRDAKTGAYHFSAILSAGLFVL